MNKFSVSNSAAAGSVHAGVDLIAPHFDAFIVDVWGVVCDGVSAFPAAVDALRHLRAIGPVALLSNTARRSHALARHLTGLGIDVDCYDVLLTAGEACHLALKSGRWRAEGQTGDGGVLYIGPDRDRIILAQSGVQECRSLKEATAIVCTGMLETLNSVEAHNRLLVEWLKRDLPFICANPDRIVRIGAKTVPCAGALAERYQYLGGRVLQFGKPEPAIYHACINKLQQLRPSLTRARILAIGDGLETDIAGANRQGLNSVLVKTGIHGLQETEGLVERKYAGSPPVPDYVATALDW